MKLKTSKPFRLNLIEKKNRWGGNGTMIVIN